MKVIIIGGVAGGASAAARLRRLDERAEIIMLERGEYISFANCGLPYYIGGAITQKKALTLQNPRSFHERFNVDVRINSEAVGIDPHTKTVTVKDLAGGGTYEEHYDKLILSPGAKPVKPAIEGIGSDRIFTLRDIPDTLAIKNYMEQAHPRSAIVVGGGYIGVETAENLKAAGLDVTIVELQDHLIAPLDYDMAADVHRYLADSGVKLILNNGVTKIEDKGALNVTLQMGQAAADMMIMAVGVTPENTLAKESGIELNERGSILTRPTMQTNFPDIYAVGDAVEVEDFITKQPAFIPLAGPANKQGRIAADQICGIPSEYTGTQGSSIIKIFNMTAAATGVNEKAAKKSGMDYDKTYIYSTSHAGYYPGANNMSIKVLWDKQTLKLLGAQIVGFDGVDKRMDVLAAAIRFGAKVTDLTSLELCYAPPFGSAKDPVNMVGFVAENVITGKLRQFFWDDVDRLPRDGSVTLLDVRTSAEAAAGKIDGFDHIPLDSLRSRIGEIPSGKPVYIHCHSGLRSYIACRILSAYGFTCYSLAGGYRMYDSAVNQRKAADYNCAGCLTQ